MADSLFSVREIKRTFPVDEEVEELLWHNAPQALLRDLHRTVKSFAVNPLGFDRHERIADAGRGAVQQMKAIIFSDYRPSITNLVPTHAMVRDSIAERRQAMTAPWADAPKFGRRNYPSTMSFDF